MGPREGESFRRGPRGALRPSPRERGAECSPPSGRGTAEGQGGAQGVPPSPSSENAHLPWRRRLLGWPLLVLPAAALAAGWGAAL